MAKFDLEEYELVADALIRLYKQFPQARVLTEDVTPEGVMDRFRFKASVFLDSSDPVPHATGHAEEITGTSMVNKTSALENCETSAIGRAISNSMLCLTKPSKHRPSREEMEKVQRAKNAMVDVKPSRPAPSAEDVEKATALIPTVASIATKDELRTIYKENERILEVKVNGTTLLDAINKRVVELG